MFHLIPMVTFEHTIFHVESIEMCGELCATVCRAAADQQTMPS